MEVVGEQEEEVEVASKPEAVRGPQVTSEPLDMASKQEQTGDIARMLINI
jgi:hypothetical protein